MIEVGEIIESSIWLDGTEKPGQREAFEKAVAENITEWCRLNNFTHEPVVFTAKKPGEDRVPPVPAHIEKKAGSLTKIVLLVAEARITGRTVEQKKARLVDNLEHKDLQRLRYITRKSHMKKYPKAPMLSNDQCDEIIEMIGPEAAMDALRKQTVVSQFH